MGNYHMRFGMRIRGLTALSPTSLIITAHAFIMIFFMVNLLQKPNLIQFKIYNVKFHSIIAYPSRLRGRINLTKKVRFYSTASTGYTGIASKI